MLRGALLVVSVCCGVGCRTAAPPTQTVGVIPAKLKVEATRGAAIHVDGIHVGDAPLVAPIEADPGPHKLVVTMDGHLPHERVVDLDRGLTHTATVDLDETTQRKWSWAAFGVGGASAVAGVVFGVLSVVEHRVAVDIEDDDLTEDEQAIYDETNARRDTYRIVSTVTAGLGVGLFVTGALLYAIDKATGVPPPKTESPSEPGVTVDVDASADGASAWATVRF